MIKGYIHKNGDGDWELGFLSELGVEGEALYTTYKTFSTWGEALDYAGQIIRRERRARA